MIQFTSPIIYSSLLPLRVIYFLLTIPPVIVIVVLFCVVDNHAITQYTWSLNRQDVEQAKKIINVSAINQNSIQLTEKELNIALSYLLNYYIHSASVIRVKKNELQFKITLFLDKTFPGRYLNISFRLIKQANYPVIHSLQIGTLDIADEFAGLLLESIIKYTPLKDYYILTAQHIRQIQINPEGLRIDYIRPHDIFLKNQLNLDNQHYRSVIFYQQKITHIIAQHNPRWRLSLADLLRPLFKLAYQRSDLSTAIAENRAVLIAISTYVNKNEIQAFLPFKISPDTPQQYTISIYQRKDMAQHFMISAVLTATGIEMLAYLIGQEKELNDAVYGSGFSFIDLASDRAGLQFGKAAVSSPASARKLQQRMAMIKDYTAFMPEVRDLPEKMTQYQFKQRYQSVYSSKYQTMLKKIDQRIAALPLYR